MCLHLFGYSNGLCRFIAGLLWIAGLQDCFVTLDIMQAKYAITDLNDTKQINKSIVSDEIYIF